MAEHRTSTVLLCGQAWAGLLDQIADQVVSPVDAHQHRCVHCQAALAELTDLWRPVHDLAASPVSTPADLVDRVMAGLRGSAPRRPPFPARGLEVPVVGPRDLA